MNELDKVYIIPRSSYDIQFLELPKVAEKDIPEALKYRLSSIYPGNPESVIFNYKITYRNKTSYKIMLTLIKVLEFEKQKQMADGKTLHTSFTLLNKLITSGKWEKIIFSNNGKWEELLIEDRKLNTL